MVSARFVKAATDRGLQVVKLYISFNRPIIYSTRLQVSRTYRILAERRYRTS